jgi:hypothetical protein
MPTRPTAQSYLARLESSELAAAASRIAGFKLRKREFGSAANISGVRDATFVFSRRLDSRTLFATDSRYGPQGKLGAWTGADKKAISTCRRILRAAGVPAAEIAKLDVVVEWGRAAERVSEKEFKVREPYVLRKIVRATRAVDGIPVWKSYVSLGLTARGDVGSLEVHWPELPRSAVKEATILQTLVKRGFKPPDIPGAKLESLEAGVVHSSAIGFYMDVVAAVRAIYIGERPEVGRKPMQFFNRHGEAIAMPRDIAARAPVDTAPRAAPKGSA